MTLKSILVVDDSEADQLIAEIAIQDYDDTIEVLKAFDGKEALELLASLPTQPSLIILDVNMPRMNGLEFLEHYQAQPKASTIVVMLSSSEQEKDKERALSFDVVQEYIVKPLEVEDLRKLETTIATTE